MNYTENPRPSLDKPSSDPFRFLDLPYDIRLLVYKHVFQDSVVCIRHKTKIEYETGNSCGLHKLAYPDSFNIISTCKTCYHDAKLLFYTSSDLMYNSSFSTRRIVTVCAKDMALHIRRLFDISFLYFEDWNMMNDYFPQLEVLGIISYPVTSKILQEHEYNKVKYEFFEQFLPNSRNQVEMLKWFKEQARFRTFINTSVTVNYFEDNMRDLERRKPIIIEIKAAKVIEGGDWPEQRYGKLFEILQAEAHQVNGR